MTSEEVFFMGVLMLLLLRILFRMSSHVEGMVSCSGLYMYDYNGTGSEDLDLELEDYDTSELDAEVAEEYKIPANTCVDGIDGQWEWKPCSVTCGKGKQFYEFVRNEGTLCVPPTQCKLGSGKCETSCTDYSADSCVAPSA